MTRLFVLLLLFLPSAAVAMRPADTLANPQMEERARTLQRELRCLVCQGESLDESTAPLAVDLRRVIREHIRGGESDTQIKQFLVARYGDFILMRPPFQPLTYALWLTPFAVLIAGLGVTMLVVARARAAPKP